LAYAINQIGPDALPLVYNHPILSVTVITVVAGVLAWWTSNQGPREQAEAATRAPARISNLPTRNPDFTGRADVMEQLGSALSQGPVAVVAVAGMGGLGKTQVALEWAHRGWENNLYRLVWWVRADSQLTLLEDLAALGPKLHIPSTADQEHMVNDVRAMLASMDQWLVVFDNAPDANAVATWLPSGNGDVVVTSRTRQWRGKARALEIHTFDRSESIKFLRLRTGESGPSLNELAETLGDLPLALAQAASYLEAHGGLSVKAYLDIYREQLGVGDMLASNLPDYPNSVATTWLIHFQHLEEHEAAALELLRLLAFVDPDEINVSLLFSRPELLDDRLAAALAVACGSKRGLEEVIGALLATALVSRIDDDHIRMHRLVGTVTRYQLAEQSEYDTRLWSEAVIGLLLGLMPDKPSEPPNWPVCGQLAAHISAAARHAPTVADTAHLLMRLGIYLRERAEYAQALEAVRHALEIYEQVYGRDHPQVAYALGHLGNVQQSMEDLHSALASQQRALAIQEAAYGNFVPEVAITLSNLGTVHRLLGDLASARESFQRALAIKESVYGPDHLQVAITLGNLGTVQRGLGDLEAARESQTRALEIKKLAYNTEVHPEVAITLGNLGLVQHALGELDAACDSLRRALALKARFYTSDHPEVAAALNNLGRVLKDLGEVREARECFDGALKIWRARFGDAHSLTRAAASNLDGLAGP
jgi:tetratricopeptide (TPR) repeat protein